MATSIWNFKTSPSQSNFKLHRDSALGFQCREGLHANGFMQRCPGTESINYRKVFQLA